MAQEPLVELAAPESSDAAQIVIAYINHAGASLDTSELPPLITSIYRAVSAGKRDAVAPAVAGPEPAVSIADSIHHDYLVCLEDGAKLKMLKRYLHSQHGMTPEQYREKWGLPKDYPMVSPAYSERRSEVAKAQGLGRKPVKPIHKPRARKAR